MRPALTHLLGTALTVPFLVELAIVLTSATGTSRVVPSPALIPTVLVYGSTIATGWLLALRVPRNFIGWALLLIGAIFLAGGVAQVLGDAFRTSDPGFTSWMYWIAGDSVNAWTWLPAVFTLLIWIPLHFPDGRLPSPRWRWLSWTSLVLLVAASVVFATGMGDPWGMPNPTALAFTRQNLGPLLLVAAGLAVVCFGGTVASLVVRYRRGDQIVRAQLRWVLWAVALATSALALGWLLGTGSNSLDQVVFGSYALIPVAIGVAVLRYHLYDIDRIISRTAAYAVVTLIVVGTYALVVLAASLALPRLPSLGVALATLAAAAVFLPALRGIRGLVDRVFDRARYDAQRVVDAFGERMRTGADPQSAAVDLARAVEQTLQPTSIGIWTRP